MISWPGRKIEKLSKHSLTGIGKLKPICSSIWWGTYRTRRASTGMLAAEGRTGKTWPCCYMRREPGGTGHGEGQAFFALVLRLALRNPRSLRPIGNSRTKNLSLVKEDEVGEPVNRLDIHKFTEAGRMYPWVLREPADHLDHLWRVAVIRRGSRRME